MAPLASLPNANCRTLKRSFTTSSISTPPCPDQATGLSTIGLQARKLRQRINRDPSHILISNCPRTKHSKMPSAAGPRMYENHIPSFMSVYDMDASLIEAPSLAPYTNQQQPQQQPKPRPQQEIEQGNTLVQLHSHQHHESTSTQTSDSTDSSPTTTISTVNSSSLSDPSPSSSPESPVTLIPLSSFSGSTFGLDSFQSLRMVGSTPSRSPLSDERPMTSPMPRKKNPKSLALNLGPSIETFQISEPSSPSFIKPPPLKARKKPSLLSLNTGAANNPSLSLDPIGSPGVSTMLQRRGLKHSISSPQILSTPSFGPSGGMTLGERKGLGPSRFKESSLAMNTFTISEDVHEAPTEVQMATRVPGVSVGGDSFDRPHTGEDAKSPSYPEGPILMHEPNVHLYLEPKVEEAMNFDVIINVAREVKNPFKVMDEAKEVKGNYPAPTSDAKNIATDMSDVTPDTADTMMSFRTAFEVLPSSSTESSPTTPKSTVDLKRPEYIHIPWDHNTDVKDELWDLCQLIESRTKEGKKVLVHCQQGASRSATLIIAYGMYINQDLGPTEAYSIAQAKSKWVNPNMSLLFSLNDFKKVIDRKKGEKSLPIRKAPMGHRSSSSVDTLEVPPTPSRARGNSTPSSWARDAAPANSQDPMDATPTASAIERLGGFDFGFGEISINNPRQERQFPEPPNHQPAVPTMQSIVPHQPIQHVSSFRRALSNDWEDLMSPRHTEMTNDPIQTFTRSTIASTEEVPPTPNLFSPRVFEFPRSTFFSMPPPPQVALPAEEDPRSPPTKGEAAITRSIDDFL